MIFVLPYRLNLKIGDKVKEIFWENGCVYSSERTIIEVRKKKTKYLCCSWSFFGDRGLNPTSHISIQSSLKFHTAVYKSLLCGKLHRIVPI